MRKITLMFFMFMLSLCGYSQGLPLEDFEGTWTTLTTPPAGPGGPAGWAIVNRAGSNVIWQQGTGGITQPAYQGTHAAYMNLENLAAPTDDWLITPAFEVPANPQLSFYSRLTIPQDQGTVYKIFITTDTGTLADQINTDNYDEIQSWTELTLNLSQQVYTLKTVEIPDSYIGQEVHIAFVMIGDNADRWLIDNVSVTEQCLDPTTLAANTIGTNTANLTWGNPSGATEWEIEVLPQAASQTGTGVTYDGALPFVAGAPGSGVTLTPNTDYKYYVRALCDDGGVSNWVGPFNFSTVAIGESCAAPIVIGGLPYSVTDNTANYGDTVDGTPGATGCGTTSPYLNGNDVFYTYQAPADGVINISVTNNGTWAGVFVYTSCANVGVSCVGGASSSSAIPLSIPSLSVTAGQTYYVVISTWATPQTTPYTLTIQQVNCAPPVGLAASNLTPTSAALSWTNPSSATSWQLVVQTPGAGIPAGAGTTVSSNTNVPVTQTTAGVAFTEATNYEYWVRADCGNGTFSAWAGPYTFMTTQVPATLDYTQNFEGVHGFSLSNGTQTNKWVVGSATANGGTQSLYISNNNGAANAYTTTAGSVVHAYRDIAVPAGTDQVSVSFDWKGVGEVNDYIRVWVVPTSFVPTPGTQIVAANGQQLGGNYTGSAAWTTVNAIADATPFDGGNCRVVFEWINNTFTGTQPPGAVDNVNIEVVTCSQPSNLAIATLTDSAATYTWTGPSTGTPTYEYYIATTSTAPTASTTPTGSVTTPTFTQTPLEPSTTYYFWVRSDCGAGGESFWTGPVSFNTPQVPATMDYTQNFDGAANGFTLSNGTQPNKWVVGTATSNSPTQSLYVSNDNGVTNAYNTSASSVVHAYRDIAITAGAEEANFSFDWKNVGETGFDYIRVWMVPITFTPTPGTQITASADRQQIGANFVGNAAWTTYNNIINVAAYDGTTRRLVFEWRNDGIIGAQPPGAVDNVNFSVITCPQPTALGATVNSETSVTLNWTNQGTATAWEVYVVESGTPAPTAATVGTPAGTNPFDVTVEGATLYTYWVRAVCGTDDKSLWSGPFTFNTPICDPTEQCNYIFVLTDDFGDGWNGNTMTVAQNGIPVATFGSTFTTGEGPVTINVPLCEGVPFTLTWNTGGSFANEVGVAVYTPFMEDLYIKPPGVGSQGTVLYTGEADCTPPLCPKPQELAIDNIELNGADLEWEEMGTATEWEVTVVPFGSEAPDEDAPIVLANVTDENPFTIDGLDSGTTYTVYIRAICGGDNGNSAWAGPITFTTAIENDDCADATTVPVNSGASCVESVPGTLVGSTGSGVVPSCNSFSTINYDAWFSFTATGESHAVNLNDQVGTFTYFTVYEGDGCGDLTQIFCGFTDFAILNDLTIGDTYYVMVYTTSSTLQPITSYSVCVTTPEPPLYVSSTDYTPAELIQDIFIGSECAIVTNVVASTGTNNGSTDNGIGYFDANGSNFPFASGIVLVSGDAEDDIPGPNSTTINANWQNPAVETALETIIGLPANTTQGGTSLSFDFEPLQDLPEGISLFEFIFASEEYGTASFECTFSDVFAFILTDLETNTSVNLAVIPGTTTPILVTNIHPANDVCPEDIIYEDLFGQYNGPLSPINLNGQTVDMSAVTPYVLEAGHQYRMQMAVANQGDNSWSSAVFLLEGSLNLGAVPLGGPFTIVGGTALCDQEDVTLNSNLDPDDHTFVWYVDGEVIEGETGPTLTVTEPGVYTMEAPVNNSDCVREGEAIVEFYPNVEVVTQDPVDLTECDGDGFATFDLTENDDVILAGLSDIYFVTYFLTEADAQGNTNAISAEDAVAFENTVQFEQEIWVRIGIEESECFGVKSFDLIIQDLTPELTITEDFAICEGTSGTITVTSDIPGVTYSWTLDGDDLDFTTATITVTEGGIYEVTANNTGCITTAEVEVTVTPAPTADDPADVVSCGPYVLPALSANNAYYTLTDAGGTMLEAGDEVTTDQTIFVYATNAIAGCTDENSFTVTIIDAPGIVQDEVEDVIACETYTLPALTVGDYYSQPGGVGTPIDTSVPITTLGETTIYVYAQAGVAPTVCTSEADFTVTISPTPVADDPADVTICDTYILPELSAGNAYYTQTNGGGVNLAAGEPVTTSQTIYVLASNGIAGCTDENEFVVTIIDSPQFVAAEVQDVVACDSYTLPALTVGTYYSQPGGVGTPIDITAPITAVGVTTIYVFAQSGTAPNICTSVAEFTVTIGTTPVIDTPANVALCDSYTLPALVNQGNYYTGPDGTGSVITAGTPIIDSQTLYVYAANGNCSAQHTFTVAIIPSAEITISEGCNDDNQYELAVNFAEEGFYTVDSDLTFEWTNAGGEVLGSEPVLVIDTPGMYYVTVTPVGDASCPITEDIDVIQTSCLIPKGISPNNDGLNDNFDLSYLDVRKLGIFNRYGKEVFSRTQYTNEWFGQTDSGEELPTGTYFYMIERNNGETQTGWVYINREEN